MYFGVMGIDFESFYFFIGFWNYLHDVVISDFHFGGTFSHCVGTIYSKLLASDGITTPIVMTNACYHESKQLIGNCQYLME